VIVPEEILDEWGRTVLEAGKAAASATTTRAYLVGGPVRDLLRGVGTEDLDLAVEGDGHAFAAELARLLAADVSSNERFLTWKLIAPGHHHVDLAMVRTETYRHPGALPEVGEATSIEEDLQRRDFTVNAMAVRLNDGELVDPFDGRSDLEAGLLRVLHDASFTDDPTRVYRGLRFARRCALTIEVQTERLLDDAIRTGALRTVTTERLWKEIDLACREQEPVPVLRSLAEWRCLEPVLGAVDPQNLDRIPDRLEAPDSVDLRIVLLGALTRGCDPSIFEAIPYDGGSISRIRAIGSRRPALADRLPAISSRDETFEVLASVSGEERFLAALERPGLADITTRFENALAVGRAIHGDRLGVRPGPWIGRAIRETQKSIFVGSVDAREATSFASRLAMKYLDEREQAR